MKAVVVALLWLIGSADFAGAAQYYFPIVAAGFTPGSSDQFYVTEFVINNPSARRIDGQLSFFALDGSSMSVGLRVVPGSTTSTESFFELSVPANGTWRAYTNETAALRTGWVILDTTEDVNSIAVFSLNSRRSGLISEASVFPAFTGMIQRLLGDTGQRSASIALLTDQTISDTGIAIANGNSQAASVTIRLLDSSGRTTQSSRITLQPFSSTSKFLREFFAGLTSFQGTVEIQSYLPIAALGLRFTGAVFTTLPVSVIQ